MSQLSNHGKFDNPNKYVEKHEIFANNIVSKPSKPKLAWSYNKGKEVVGHWNMERGCLYQSHQNPNVQFFHKKRYNHKEGVGMDFPSGGLFWNTKHFET